MGDNPTFDHRFFVDDIPIRVFKNKTSNGVKYPSKPMQILSSLWDGEDWATDGGKEKTDWTQAPFIAGYQGFSVDGCRSSDWEGCSSSSFWWNSAEYSSLSPAQQKAYEDVKNYTSNRVEEDLWKDMGSEGLLPKLLSLSIFLVLLEEAFAATNGHIPSQPKPPPAAVAATARWLVSQSTWGVLSTISSELGGAPFGNVVSFSDGLPGDGRGIPYFYLTPLDPTARNAMKDVRSSFTLSEFPLGTCGKKDPENPTCSKLTLTGKRSASAHILRVQKLLILVDVNSKEAEFAKRALFTKHHEMMGK
ncbi:hypothetical protein ACLOJK_030941 [Asimina triloba]